MKKYKHKKTGKLFMKGRDAYFEINPKCELQFSNQEFIPSWAIESSSDWELIDDFWELKIDQNKNMYFENTMSGDVFRVGDRITIKNPQMKFGDEVRNHQISGFNFYSSSYSPTKTSLFKKVFACFEGYDPNDRVLTLDEMIKI